ncbi:MAG: methionine--tRNA ligase subunit beta [Candidatus Paceibacterota bacterium]|jgi:methionine--tRNA ligase beta chain
MDLITYEDFKKLDLRVAKILEAERVENSEKLIKLQIDLGEEKRQIVAGIGKFYNPEDLINKQIVVICNLEPKTLMGLESNGMLLAASNEDQISLLIPDTEISPGSIVR